MEILLEVDFSLCIWIFMRCEERENNTSILHMCGEKYCSHVCKFFWKWTFPCVSGFLCAVRNVEITLAFCTCVVRYVCIINVITHACTRVFNFRFILIKLIKLVQKFLASLAEFTCWMYLSVGLN